MHQLLVDVAHLQIQRLGAVGVVSENLLEELNATPHLSHIGGGRRGGTIKKLIENDTFRM